MVGKRFRELEGALEKEEHVKVMPGVEGGCAGHPKG